jgi:hypothetical protein
MNYPSPAEGIGSVTKVDPADPHRIEDGLAREMLIHAPCFARNDLVLKGGLHCGL